MFQGISACTFLSFPACRVMLMLWHFYKALGDFTAKCPLNERAPFISSVDLPDVQYVPAHQGTEGSGCLLPEQNICAARIKPAAQRGWFREGNRPQAVSSVCSAGSSLLPQPLIIHTLLPSRPCRGLSLARKVRRGLGSGRNFPVRHRAFGCSRASSGCGSVFWEGSLTSQTSLRNSSGC